MMSAKILGALANTISHTSNAPLTCILEPGSELLELPLTARTAEAILYELVDHAVKFHPQHAPQIEIHLHRQEDRVNLQFCDDGFTLSPEQIARAWMPFYQGEKYQTGEVVGMGLGLATVALQIWNVGGTCRLSNRAGQPGVCVEIQVPVRNTAGA